MTTRIKDDSPSQLAPVLRLDLLERLHCLNADYLELLCDEGNQRTVANQLNLFPSRLHQAIGRLTSDMRQRIARTPYTLYSLRFQEERFWQRASAPSEMSLDARYLSRCNGSLQGSFCELALIEAWQTARTFPLAARLIYSMCERVREGFARMPLWQVRRLAMDHPSLLAPRWPTRAGFWPDLFIFAAAKDLVRLNSVQLLGTQFIASELSSARSVDRIVG